jgi:integrase
MAIKKLRSGKYQIDYYDNEHIRTRKSYDTQRDAKDALANIRGRVRANEYVPERKIPKFSEQADEWLAGKSAGKTARRPGTRANWRAHLDRHLNPKIGAWRLDYITVARVEKVRIELLGSGLSVSSAQAIITTLGAVLKMAKRHGTIRQNVVEDIERMYEGSKERKDEDEEAAKSVDPAKVLNPAEIALLLANADEGYYRTLFQVAFITGMRNGELFALRWTDVELGDLGATGKGKIQVKWSLTWANDGDDENMTPRFFEPKTKAGTRTIWIPPSLVSALKVWKLRCPPGELVFPDSDGRPMHRANALKRGLRPALRRAQLRQVTMHSLRHSCASAMIANGAVVTEVQHKLGHSSPNVTLRVYAHWFENTESDATERMTDTLIADMKKGARNQDGHFLDTLDADAEIASSTAGA